HEQQVALVAQPAQAPEEFVGARRDAALALDRLDEDRRRLVVDEVDEALEIVDLTEREARHERAEALLDFFLRRRAHPAVGAAVKRVFRPDDLEALRLLAGFAHAVQARELDQALVRLGAAVAEENAAGAGLVHETPREFALVRMPEKIADV